MALLTIVSAFILVIVIVYATNTSKINELMGWGQKKGQEVEADVEEEQTPVIYGDQIGDNLNAFLLDDDFFDETEKIPSVVVRKKTNSSSAGDTAVGTVGIAGEQADPDALVGDDGIRGDDEDISGEGSTEREGTGMAVVGQLINPNPTGTNVYNTEGGMGSGSDSSGYLTTLPEAPAGGYGQYIPAGETISGTPVGNTP